MHVSTLVRWIAGLSVVAVWVVSLTGCDVPTEGPSFETEAEVRSPLVAKKTFSFLGGPKSEHEPLVDTTTSTFESLFTVGKEPKDIAIEQTVDNFTLGTLNNAVDEAAGDLSSNKQFAEPIVRDSDISAQEVDASYSKSNEVYKSGSQSNSESGLYDQSGNDEIVVPFPKDNLLEAPDFGAVDASGATVESVSLTEESGGGVNSITFTLTNDGSNTLTNGNGEPPEIWIEDTEGTLQVLVKSSFDKTINDGESATTVVDVSGLTLGTNTPFRLIVAGTNSGETATLDSKIEEWHYQAATLSDASNTVNIRASQDPVSARGDDASRFEGIEGNDGSLTLAVDNQFSFDLSVNRIQIQNKTTPSWVDISALNIDETIGNIESGKEGTATVSDWSNRGIAADVKVDVTASPVNDVITVTADDVLNVSNSGTIGIKTLYFRPGGEVLHSSGTIEMGNDQVTFEDGDYLELADGLIDIKQFESDPQLTFDEFTLSYPDLLHPSYAPGDSVVVRFVKNPEGKFEVDQVVSGGGARSFDVSLEGEDVRVFPNLNQQVSPAVNELDYTLRGRLEENPQAEGVAHIDDRVSADMSIGKFDIRELKASHVKPFAVQVTPDENGDGNLDVADDSEVSTSSFDGFQGITNRVDGLEFSGGNLNFSTETENLGETTVQLYTALQGKSGTSGFFLAGAANTERAVSSSSFEKEFTAGGISIPRDSLIQFDIELEAAGADETVRRTHAVEDENSNISPFLSRLPSEIRLAGQADLNEDGGDIILREPVEIDAGFDVSIPLQINGTFTVQDTFDADFSSLKEVTDPDKNLTVTKAVLQLRYLNKLPLGADVEMTIVDQAGASLRHFPEETENDEEEELRIAPAPKDERLGAADGSREGTLKLNLGQSQEALSSLAEGEEIRLRLTMEQTEEGPPARIRADDTLQLSMQADIEASVRTGD